MTAPSYHPLYNTWTKMLDRCLDAENASYRRYGGRGITVCWRWQESFWNFLADMGERPDGRSLDRRDNDGPYSPENCRWATPSEQNRNTSVNKYATINGERKLVIEWCEQFGVSFAAVNNRLHKGWGIEAALYWPEIKSKPGYKPKLTADDVLAIRSMSGSMREIGEIFGVHNTTISQIKRRVIYANLENDLEVERLGRLYANLPAEVL